MLTFISASLMLIVGAMEIVNLGRHGLKVSRLCLGTMVFGAQID